MSEKELIARLKAAGICVATAESCTGGGLAQRLTAVPGSSHIFWGGWITYDNSAKQSQLGVAPELLTHHGAVSAPVAGAMAEGGLSQMTHAIQAAESSSVSTARKLVCLSTTGIAGPDGGSEAKPVGLCFVGIAATGLPTAVIEIRTPAGMARELNQAAFADAALQALTRLTEHWK